MRHRHTPEGAADPGLTEEGQRHARLLADFFTEEPPATIFVSTTKRARQTAAPLAAKLGITPRLYDPRDTAGLITAVMKDRKSVVQGKSVSVRVALGGRRIIDKKKNIITHKNHITNNHTTHTHN